MYMCAFQSMKSVDDGIARRDSRNDLVGTVALPTINNPKDIRCGMILKDHQNQEVTGSFCQLNLLLKAHGACTMHVKRVPTPAPSNNFIFHC